jgi:hypothetical protein
VIDEPTKLASLLEIGRGAEPTWSTRELGAILRHQMRAPLEGELRNWYQAPAGRRGRSAGGAASPRTLHELLRHPRPSVALLRGLKEYAKDNAAANPPLLPADIGLLLYYLAIALAMTRTGEVITGLGVDEIREGVSWAAAQDWIDDDLRRCFSACLKALERPQR